MLVCYVASFVLFCRERTGLSLTTDRLEMPPDNSRLAPLDHKTNLHIRSDSSKDGSSNIKEYLKEMIQFYDIERQDSSDSEEDSPEAVRTHSRTVNTITCNGHEMVREQCALNGKEEYMYDWYYLSHCSKEDVDNL